MKYRIIDRYVVDASADPEASFHPDIAVQFEDAPVGASEGLGVGWRFDGEDWLAPPPPPEPEPAPVVHADLTFVQFVGLAMQAGGMTPTAYATAIANPALVVFFDLLKHAQGIRKDDPMIAIGGAAFVSEGMIEQEGWEAMLASWPEA